MEKFFTILAIFAVVLAGCGDGTPDNNENESSTTLRIKNESFSELTDVVWQGVSFFSNSSSTGFPVQSSQNWIAIGSYATKNVEAGSGYIFFRRKTNPIIARTRDLVVIEAGEQVEFTFTDNTVVAEVGSGTNGTLGGLQGSILWFDGFEGDVNLSYTQTTSVTYVSSSFGVYPKNGSKFLQIRGTHDVDGELSFTLSLTRNAKLSFWHGAQIIGGGGALLNINGTETRSWSGDNSWSFAEYSLESGEISVQFKAIYAGSSLYLDDLMVSYTE